MVVKVSDAVEAEIEVHEAYLPEIENIQRRADGTYVVTYGGVPYHTTEAVTPDVYARVLTMIEGGAVVTDYAEPEISKPDPLAEAISEYNRLRGIADFVILPLQDAVDIGDATGTEAVTLTAWKKYRVALSRVLNQPNYPANVEWPTPPT